MSDNNLKHTIISTADLDDSEFGQWYLFVVPNEPDDFVFRFSSTLEGISNPETFDRTLKNKTRVLVLGEPTEAYHPTAGKILVSKILAHDVMYVKTFNLEPIEDN